MEMEAWYESEEEVEETEARTLFLRPKASKRRALGVWVGTGLLVTWCAASAASVLGGGEARRSRTAARPKSALREVATSKAPMVARTFDEATMEEADAASEMASPGASDVVRREVTYAQGLGECADVFDPATCASTMDLTAVVSRGADWEAGAARPAVVLAHGGAFDRSALRPLWREMTDFFVRAGFVVVEPFYRIGQEASLTPRGFPLSASLPDPATFQPTWTQLYAPMRDLKAAVRYVKANAADLGVDPRRVVASGSSAGATLCVGLATTREAAFTDELLGADPTLDSTNLEFSSKVAGVFHYLGGAEALMFQQAHRAEAVKDAVDSDAPPIFAVLGAEDTVINPANSRYVCESLKLANPAADCAYTAIPGRGHMTYGIWHEDTIDFPPAEWDAQTWGRPRRVSAPQAAFAFVRDCPPSRAPLYRPAADAD